MSQCDECGCFDDWHIDNVAGTDEEVDENHKDYANDLDYYWHGDIQEDYQMPAGYCCLCEECFGDFFSTGRIIDIDSPNWDATKHGWYTDEEIK